MFEQYVTEPVKPRYAKIGSYIITLDQIHGVMSSKAESKEFPYQVFITYVDKELGSRTVVLEMPSKEECDKACDKIAEHLGAI